MARYINSKILLEDFDFRNIGNEEQSVYDELFNTSEEIIDFILNIEDFSIIKNNEIKNIINNYIFPEFWQLITKRKQELKHNIPMLTWIFNNTPVQLINTPFFDRDKSKDSAMFIPQGEGSIDDELTIKLYPNNNFYNTLCSLYKEDKVLNEIFLFYFIFIKLQDEPYINFFTNVTKELSYISDQYIHTNSEITSFYINDIIQTTVLSKSNYQKWNVLFNHTWTEINSENYIDLFQNEEQWRVVINRFTKHMLRNYYSVDDDLNEDFDFSTYRDNNHDGVNDVIAHAWLLGEFQEKYLPLWKYNWVNGSYLNVNYTEDGKYIIELVEKNPRPRPLQIAEIIVEGNDIDIVLLENSDRYNNRASDKFKNANYNDQYICSMAVDMRKNNSPYRIRTIYLKDNDIVFGSCIHGIKYFQKITKDIIPLLPNIRVDNPAIRAHIVLTEIYIENEETIKDFIEYLGKQVSNCAVVWFEQQQVLLPHQCLSALNFGRHGRNDGSTAKIVRKYVDEFIPQDKKRKADRKAQWQSK